MWLGKLFNLKRRGLETESGFSLAISRLCKELGRVSNFNQSKIWQYHMKNHVEMDLLSKFDAFMLNREQESKLWTFRHGLKSIQMSVISWQRPPKPYKLLKTFRSSVTTVKSSHSPAIWTEGKIAMFSLFYEYHRNCKKIKTSLYDFGGRSKEFRGVCMDFEPLPKVHSLILVQSKSIKLFHMIHLKVIFHVVLSNYRFVKIWNPSQFLAQPRNGRLVNTVNGR